MKISSYQLRQVLANFCKLVTLILAYNCVKGLRVTKIVKQIKFEGVWGDSSILRGKDWCFTQFSTGIASWLLLMFLTWLLNQLSSIHSIISTIPLSIISLKNVIHEIDSKNGWLLLSVSFTTKFGLILVLTLENAFS